MTHNLYGILHVNLKLRHNVCKTVFVKKRSLKNPSFPYFYLLGTKLWPWIFHFYCLYLVCLLPELQIFRQWRGNVDNVLFHPCPGPWASRPRASCGTGTTVWDVKARMHPMNKNIFLKYSRFYNDKVKNSSIKKTA